ncbi:MAG: adenine-specific methyltransferase EcoRI family protein [Nitrosopumilus sp.]|nr:adenine-specific methyltransferase EcoRI family protein [Nitrosopumilus sp.]
MIEIPLFVSLIDIMFFHYFSHNFEELKLKKLITTCYINQDMNHFSKNDSERTIYLEYKGNKNDNKIPDHDETSIFILDPMMILKMMNV